MLSACGGSSSKATTEVSLSEEGYESLSESAKESTIDIAKSKAGISDETLKKLIEKIGTDAYAKDDKVNLDESIKTDDEKTEIENFCKCIKSTVSYDKDSNSLTFLSSASLTITAEGDNIKIVITLK